MHNRPSSPEATSTGETPEPVRDAVPPESGRLKALLRKAWLEIKAEQGAYAVSVFVAAALSFALRSGTNYICRCPETGGWANHHSTLLFVVETCVTVMLFVVCLVVPKKVALAGQFALGFLLMYVFIASLHEEHPKGYPWLLGLTFTCLVLYFMAETLEIAFTQLHAKESDQMLKADRDLVDEIAKSHHVFYEAREWLVILLVVCLTVISDFDNLHAFGMTTEMLVWKHLITLSFSLLFTTVLVLWLAQSPGKSLALDNPVRCLQSCRWIWPVLKFFGERMKSAQIFKPGDLMTRFLRKVLPGFKDIIPLKTSDAAFYSTGIKRYGYSLHSLHDEVKIAPDGSASYKQTGVFYISCGYRTEFIRWFKFDKPVKLDNGKPLISHEVRTFILPNFEDRLHEKIIGQLAELSAGNYANACEIFFGLQVRSEVERGQPEADEADNNSPRGKKFNVWIKSPKGLPEEIPDIEKAICACQNIFGSVFDEQTPAVAIRFTIAFNLEEGAFKRPPAGQDSTEQDSFYRSFAFPCSEYTAHLTLVDENGAIEANKGHEFSRVENHALLAQSPHPMEQSRIKTELIYQERGLNILVRHPVPGVEYKTTWHIWDVTNELTAAAATAEQLTGNGAER